MLLLLHIVWTMISCIYGAAIDAVQESVALTTAELRDPVPIEAWDTWNFAILIREESLAIYLSKEVKEVEDRKVKLEGQKFTCMLREDEASESYAMKEIDADAIIISRITDGILDRKMVMRFQYEDRMYALEPDWNSFIRCHGKEEKREPLAILDVFGEIHFLYEIDEDSVIPISEEIATTTEGGPVDPPEPPIMMIIIIVVCSLILLALVAICFCRCCCRSAPSYKSM